MKYTKEQLIDYILNFNPRMRGSSLSNAKKERLSALMIEALTIIDKDYMERKLKEFMGDK